MNSEYKSALFLSIKIGYLSSFQKQAANSLVTETLQYFVLFCRYDYHAILAKCLIINDLRLIRTILFFIAFLNITYTARHTCATLLIHQGVPITTVQKLLGHTSVKTTEIYSEVLSSTILRDLKAVKSRKKRLDFQPNFAAR